MANQNNQKNVNNGTEQQVEQVKQTAEQPVVQAQANSQIVTQPPMVPEKQGIGSWCKQHWKGLVASITSAIAIGGSAVVAYKKGKAAGIMSVPMPPQNQEDDYSLNPNE